MALNACDPYNIIKLLSTHSYDPAVCASTPSFFIYIRFLLPNSLAKGRFGLPASSFFPACIQNHGFFEWETFYCLCPFSKIKRQKTFIYGANRQRQPLYPIAILPAGTIAAGSCQL